MSDFFYPKKSNWMRKTTSSFVALAFLLSLIFGPATGVNAQYISNLPKPGEMVLLSPAFQPPVLKGMTLHPENPLQFDFIVDRGQDKLSGDALKGETQKLLKYFLAAMTIPDNDSWVNLSPYEGDRIIPDMLGSTDMGKQMLEQDYLLKQLSASLTNPQEEIGKKFWDTVYKKAYEKFGSTSVPINTFNKVWIVPDRALILEEDGYVFIGESHLKVMLDQDYTSLKENLKSEKLSGKNVSQDKAEALSSVSSEVVRQIILPELEKEINEGKNFAAVRQIYHSVILATWYKQNLKNSLLGKIYVDKSKIAGVNIGEKDLKQKVYEQYLAAFRKGVYNLIKEDYDLASKETLPRKYFSGGFDWKATNKVLKVPESVAKKTEISRSIQKAIEDNRFASAGVITAEQPKEEQAVQAAVASASVENFEKKSVKLIEQAVRNIQIGEQKNIRQDIAKTLVDTNTVGIFIEFVKTISEIEIKDLNVRRIITEINKNKSVIRLLISAIWTPLLNASVEEAPAAFVSELKKINKLLVEQQKVEPVERRLGVDRRVAAEVPLNKKAVVKGLDKINPAEKISRFMAEIIASQLIRMSWEEPSSTDDLVSQEAKEREVLLLQSAYSLNKLKNIGESPERAEVLAILSKPATQESTERLMSIFLANKGYRLANYAITGYPFTIAHDAGALAAVESGGAMFFVLAADDPRRKGLLPYSEREKMVSEGIRGETVLGILGVSDVSTRVLDQATEYARENKRTDRDGEYNVFLFGAELVARLGPENIKRLKDAGIKIKLRYVFGSDHVDWTLPSKMHEGLKVIRQASVNELTDMLKDIAGVGKALKDIQEAREIAQFLYGLKAQLLAGELSDEAILKERLFKQFPEISAQAVIDQLKQQKIAQSDSAKKLLDNMDARLFGFDPDLFEMEAFIIPRIEDNGIPRDEQIDTINRKIANLRKMVGNRFEIYSPELYPIDNVSATAIRQNKSYYFMSPAVERYVRENGIFGYSLRSQQANPISDAFLEDVQLTGLFLKFVSGYFSKGDNIFQPKNFQSITQYIGLLNDIHGNPADVIAKRAKAQEMADAFAASSPLGQEQVASSANVVANAAAQSAPAVGQATVLVVDGRLPSAALSRQLIAAGYSVVVEPDVQKAAALASNNFDVIIAGNAQESQPVIRQLIDNGNKAKFVIFASAEALLDPGVQELKDNRGVILQAKRSSADVNALVGAIQNKVPAYFQKVEANTPTAFLQLGDYERNTLQLFTVIVPGEVENILGEIDYHGQGKFDLSLSREGDMKRGVSPAPTTFAKNEKGEYVLESSSQKRGNLNVGDVSFSVVGNQLFINAAAKSARVGFSSMPLGANAAQAQVGASVAASPVGGIDFDPTLLNLQIKRNGRGVPLPLPEQNLENINIDGLYPVIINMQPATIQNFPFLISADKNEKVPELSMRPST